MDPITLILTALLAGAVTGVKDTASAAVADAYNGLKALLQHKFSNHSKAQTALIDYEDDPDTYEKPLRKALSEASLDGDQDILAAAQHILSLVQQQQTIIGHNVVQNASLVQGQVVENSGSITMTFGEIPKKEA